jgi:hypothetical protein
MPSAQRVLIILAGEKLSGESYATCVLRLIAASRESAADLALMRSERDHARTRAAALMEELVATGETLAEQVEITTKLSHDRTAAIDEKLAAVKAATEARRVLTEGRVAHGLELLAVERRAGMVASVVGSAVGSVVTWAWLVFG